MTRHCSVARLVDPHAVVLAWFAQQPADSLFVSAVTQAEMLSAARLLPHGKRRQQLETALDAMFRKESPSPAA